MNLSGRNDLFPSRTRVMGTGKEEKRREEGMQGEKGRKRNHGGFVTLERVHREVPLPLLMLTEKFVQEWNEWVEYRLEAGKEMRWTTSIRCFSNQLKKLEEMGPERGVNAIEFSIMMGYRGIFEPLEFGRPKPVTTKKWSEMSPEEKKFAKWKGL